MALTTSWDPDAIPVDRAERVLRIPIPLDVNGKPVCSRADLAYESCARRKQEHQLRVEQIMVERAQIIERTTEKWSGRDSLRAEVMALSRKDLPWWFDHFVWTIDPRLKDEGDAQPLVLYQSQAREVRFYQDEWFPMPAGVWLDEKSRAWGATWIHVAGCPLHSFLFQKGYSCILGAATQDDVDNGGIEADPGCHMGKIRFILRHLPLWMVPDGLLDNEKLNKMFVIRHPKNENMIRGKQYGSKFGRSQRYSEGKYDEAAWGEAFEAAMTSASLTTRKHHIISTPQGRNNEFARIRFSGSKRVIVRSLHWSHNPTLDPDYYWLERETWGRTKIAQELDISYDSSTSLAIYPTFDRKTAIVYAQPAAEGQPELPALDYDPALPLCCAIDPGWDDPFAVVWIQPDRKARLWNIIDFVQYEGRPGEFFIPFLLGYTPEATLEGRPWPYEYDARERAIIEKHKSWGAVDEATGDAYGSGGASVMTTGRSLYDTFYEYGFVDVYPVKVTNKEDAIENVRKALPRIRIAPAIAEQRTGHKDAPTIVECFEHYSWVERISPTGREMKRAPRHDKYCHAMDALQQFFLDEPVEPTAQPVVPRGLLGRTKLGRRIGTMDVGAPRRLRLPSDPITGG